MENLIAKHIASIEDCAFRFKPTKEFYKVVAIKQKRFGQLLRNEKEAFQSELDRLANFFCVPVSSLIKKP